MVFRLVSNISIKILAINILNFKLVSKKTNRD